MTILRRALLTLRRQYSIGIIFSGCTPKIRVLYAIFSKSSEWGGAKPGYIFSVFHSTENSKLVPIVPLLATSVIYLCSVHLHPGPQTTCQETPHPGARPGAMLARYILAEPGDPGHAPICETHVVEGRVVNSHKGSVTSSIWVLLV